MWLVGMIILILVIFCFTYLTNAHIDDRFDKLERKLNLLGEEGWE